MLEHTIQRLMGDVTLSGIVSAENHWSYQESYTVIARPSNQLFCNLEGVREYCDEAGCKLMTVYPGDVLLMPTGSSYVTAPCSPEGNRGLAVLFNLRDAQGQEIILDQQVRLVARDENGYYAQTVRRLLNYMLQGGFASLKAKELLYDILYTLATDQSLMQSSPRRKSLAPAIRCMEDNLQASLSIDMLAEMCFMSKSTFHRRFLAEYHISPTVYHLNMRMQKSRELLLSSLYSVEQVAEIMGFCDTGYFSRMFRKITGLYAGECRHSVSTRRGSPPG